MREIKFDLLVKDIRGIWSHHNGSNDSSTCIDLAGNLWIITDNGERLPNPFKEDYFALRQFTGLKDKNGKEIYEGDIIEWNWKNEPDKKERDVVEWRVNLGNFLIPSGFNVTSLLAWEFKFKVVGNIYENPELISEQKYEDGR